MSNWKPAAIAAVLVAAIGVSAGVVASGDEAKQPAERTVVTETVQAPPSPARSPAPSQPQRPPEEGAAAGAVIDGQYAMEYLDYSPAQINLADTYTGKVMQWDAEAQCEAGSCAVEMRRELSSGGYKTYTLALSPDDPLVWVGTATAQFSGSFCEPQQVEERLSMRVTASEPVDGRETATAMDVYLRVPLENCSYGNPGNEQQAVAKWRGARRQ